MELKMLNKLSILVFMMFICFISYLVADTIERNLAYSSFTEKVKFLEANELQCRLKFFNEKIPSQELFPIYDTLFSYYGVFENHGYLVENIYFNPRDSSCRKL